MGQGRITFRRTPLSPAREDTYLWIELPGFGLKVTPAGRKVPHCVTARRSQRPDPRVTIGQHSQITPTLPEMKLTFTRHSCNWARLTGRRDGAKADKSVAATFDQFPEGTLG
jgi:hypothetical protein